MIKINQELCVGCGLCISDCTGKLIREKDGVMTGPDTCMECGHCVAICPKGAVSMEGYDMSEVLELDPSCALKPEDVLMTIKSRRSIRKYADRKIGAEQLHCLIEAARYTATASNRQGSSYVFVQDQLDTFRELAWDYIDRQTSVGVTKLDQVWSIYYSFLKRRQKDAKDDFLFRNAPAVMIITTPNPWDAGLEAQNIEMQAVSMGMGVLYNGFMARLIDQSEELKKWLGIEHEHVSAVMLLGYPDVTYRRTVPRKPAKLIMR